MEIVLFQEIEGLIQFLKNEKFVQFYLRTGAGRPRKSLPDPIVYRGETYTRDQFIKFLADHQVLEIILTQSRLELPKIGLCRRGLAKKSASKATALAVLEIIEYRFHLTRFREMNPVPDNQNLGEGRLLSLTQAAKYLSVSKSTIYRMGRNKKLTLIKINNNTRVIQTDLMNYVSECRRFTS
jgi:excisionase family DNA binding protein